MKDCKAYENTVILDGHRDYRSETVVLMGDNCSAPPGNSGAVVISHDTGEVVGSVHAYLDDAAQKYEELGYRLSDEGALNPVVVTNFSCLLSDVVEASSAISGCDNVDRVVAQKRRSSWQQISMDYENALQSSEQEAQALFDTSAVEISHLLEVEAFRENESPLFSPLRRNFETLVPKFLCHAQSAPASTISFNAAEREVFQYLDKTLRIKAKKVVEPKAKNYSLQPVGGSYLRITESDSGQASDLPLCN